MRALSAGVAGLGLAAPGLDGWDAFAAALAAPAWEPDAAWAPTPACLAPRAARRLSPQIRLALAAAEQIAPALPGQAGWVFASACGEGETLNAILEALTAAEPMIQPLRFQNAVHNAAAGQWTIAEGLTGPASSIAAYDETAGAGMLKALLQVALEGRPVGLVIYDAPLPAPLDEKRPMGLAFAAALALLPEGGAARLSGRLAPGGPTPAESAVARALMATGNPAAAILPLLERLARGEAGAVRLGLHGAQALELEVAP